jgi:dTDP-4-dehydrorhamnose reductase
MSRLDSPPAPAPAPAPAPHSVSAHPSSLPTRVLLIGARGQVGQALLQQLGPQCVLALDRQTPGQSLDLQDLESLAERLHDYIGVTKPSVIINAAAYTAVDLAQTEQSLAYDINALAPGLIANVACACGLPLVHYSTDYVFDGQSDKPYTEADPTNPLSVYGSSKLAGERAVIAAAGQHLIFRTSWVFGEHGQNFLRTMLRLAQERPQLRIVNDQVGAPTSARLIAAVTIEALSQLHNAHDPRWGLYHLSAAGQTSWHGYACYLIEQARQLGWSMHPQLTESSIVGIPASDYPTAAARPASSRLNTDKLSHAFGVSLPPWQTGVRDVLHVLYGMSALQGVQAERGSN